MGHDVPLNRSFVISIHEWSNPQHDMDDSCRTLPSFDADKSSKECDRCLVGTAFVPWREMIRFRANSG